jgi:hypothetical protein
MAMLSSIVHHPASTDTEGLNGTTALLERNLEAAQARAGNRGAGDDYQRPDGAHG